MNFAIILSGGIGSRMRTDGFPKQYIEINGKPILLYTLEKFEKTNCVDKIVIVADDKWHSNIKNWILKFGINSKFAGFAKPGNSRQRSILNGLEFCKMLSHSETDNVIIHDGVRPCVTEDLIKACLDACSEYDGCMPVIPVTDTIYYSEDGKEITNLLDRSKLFAGQAPEAFRFNKYYEINKSADLEEIENTKGTTEIAYRNGLNIRLIPGEYANFKLTTPTDLERFKTVLGL